MRAIDADAFDERVRVAGGMSEEELTEDFKDGVQAVLYMLSNQPTIQPELSTNLAEVGTDCISRQAAIDALGELPTFTQDWSYNTWMYTDDVYNAIKELPPIQPKRGRWVLVCDNNGMHFICNKCGAWRYHQEQKFCGECGADMREKGENNESN